MAKKKAISTEEFDRKFDKNEDMSKHVDWDAATKTINVDIPVWAIKALDDESTRRGVARQALIKMWIIDRIDSLKEKKLG
jgi:hypothetical protein